MSRSLNDSRVAGGWNVRVRLDTSAGLIQPRVPCKHQRVAQAESLRVVADQETGLPSTVDVALLNSLEKGLITAVRLEQ